MADPERQLPFFQRHRATKAAAACTDCHYYYSHPYYAITVTHTHAITITPTQIITTTICSQVETRSLCRRPPKGYFSQLLATLNATEAEAARSCFSTVSATSVGGSSGGEVSRSMEKVCSDKTKLLVNTCAGGIDAASFSGDGGGCAEATAVEDVQLKTRTPERRPNGLVLQTSCLQTSRCAHHALPVVSQHMFAACSLARKTRPPLACCGAAVLRCCGIAFLALHCNYGNNRTGAQ